MVKKENTENKESLQFQVKSAAVMKERIGGEISVSYADVAEIACQTGSQQFIKYSKLARLINYTQTCTVRAKTISNRILVNVFICITQFGFCCIYTVFMGANMKQVTESVKESILFNIFLS